MMEQMKELTPKVQELEKKYKGQPRNISKEWGIVSRQQCQPGDGMS